MVPKIGETVEIDNKVRIITGIIKNLDGNPIVMWSSKNDIGGCTPSLWKEWRNGFDPKKRRDHISKYEYYKL